MSKGPITVVIVEDDENAVNIYKQFTNQLDQFTVIATASTGKQALNILHAAQPDLILLDIFLPDMNGIDLLREIRREYRGIDVILITAANDTETVSEAIRGGAFGYLIKPIIIDKLLATLNQYDMTRRQLHNSNLVNQDKVDTLFRTISNSNTANDVQMNSLPKGIDKHTLKMVRSKIQNVNGSLNADELGQLVGISYSTMRRYLEYLVSCNEMEVEVLYGSVGRPERKYKIKHM
ncbi:response regulator [Peribacillus frigoritolerans]|jgi:two-component system CitB family response regulator|uniref:response regulator n=1 Tax=Peribacillus frigoritolerans TaxID=450367 RepID=UPI000BFCD558|nr:response regulator [Peribacillus frigoritolerans]MDP9739515.1 response regulator of citrate/malate metabolism [Bacillus sp. B2I3]PHD72680.1 response regulator [Bacillus sp. AFS043905]MCY8937397.1 response regulator [Peribacillus frigoritolerans]MED4634830.1 response regulator [Peribacillus frigoritolerans]MED4692569.1 response regulator [Peribacillus frigoritolerans]